MTWKIFSGWWRRRPPDYLDDLTAGGLTRATQSHAEEIAYEMEKDPAIYLEMLERTERMFTLLAGVARAKRESFGEKVGFRMRKKPADAAESPPGSPPAAPAAPPPRVSPAPPTASPPGAAPSP